MPRANLTILWLVPIVLLFQPACTLIHSQVPVVQSNIPYNNSPQVPDSDLGELVRGNSAFAFDWYHQAAGSGDNLFYSPYSISIALAMTYAGASGETATQMAQALHFTLVADRLHPAFNRLALALASRSKEEGVKPGEAFQLNVANSLWGQSGFHFEQPFLDVLAQNYAAGMRLVDYRKDPEAARGAINDWVSQSTNRKIQNLIPQGALGDLTRLVLANAVYFKSAWENPFDKNLTQPQTFHLADGGGVQVEMMYQSNSLEAMLGDGYRAAALPYAGGQLSMLVLLPDEGRFSDLEGRLNARLVAETVAAMQPVEADLSLPKYKFEWSTELSSELKALGMTDAFDPDRADFSGMDAARDLYISLILHKAFVSVDEQGTEAAAATAVVMEAMSMPGSPVQPMEFKADHPFIFLIRDNPTGTILFVGRVMNPAAS
jgi:serpin B